MPNGANSGQGPNFHPNDGRVIQNGGTRILCVADVRGRAVDILIPKP